MLIATTVGPHVSRTKVRRGARGGRPGSLRMMSQFEPTMFGFGIYEVAGVTRSFLNLNWKRDVSGTDIEARSWCPLNSQRKQPTPNDRGSLAASPCSGFVTSCHLISHRHATLRSASVAPRRASQDAQHGVPPANRTSNESRNREWFRFELPRTISSDSMRSLVKRVAHVQRYSDGASGALA